MSSTTIERRPSDAISRTHRVETVAKRLDVSVPTVRRMIAEGNLSVVRPLGAGRGKLVLVTEQSIRDFIDAATREG